MTRSVSLEPLLVVGGGRMGSAIVAGALGAGVVSPEGVVVAEPDQAARGRLASEHGVLTVPDAREVAGKAATVLLAVKPQVIDDVVRSFADALKAGSLVISIAAGVPTARLEGLLPETCRVVRVMPNTPSMVGQGVSAVSPGSRADSGDVDAAVRLLGALGRVVVLDEHLQDAVTAVSGSGPAYVAMFVRALAEAAEDLGLDPVTAYTLALQTAKGTAALLEETGMTPTDLVDAVSSPGGTTVAARGVLEAEDFEGVLKRAVRAARDRAEELGRG